MSLGRLFISAMVLCLALTSLPVVANSDNDAWRHQASSLYSNEDYDKAYKTYLKLGKKGDRFSAYRVSYMMLKGQGTRENLIESFAWAVIAAENGPPELSKYRDAVGALIPVKDRNKAQQKVDYYMRRWGPEDENTASRERGGCTTSRLAAACNPSQQQQKWISWRKEVPPEQDVMEQIEALNQSIAENPADLETTAAES